MQNFTNEDIKEKLEYIGLDLENIPEIFTNTKEIEYRPLKLHEDNGYRVYKYIPVSKIQILLTPMNRLNTIKEKYTNASSIKEYLVPQKEEDVFKHNTFLRMLKEVQIEEIEKLTKEQEALNKNIPFKVKFEENYLWQIYYSDIDDVYFMLVPTEDLEYASFFYLLKKQIECYKNKEEQMIFVPISYENYSNKYLKTSELLEIEKYLWYFTNNFPNLYDVYDKSENLSLQITGEIFCYENIKSVYKNKLENKENALKFYKFLKALFMLSTEIPHHYKFSVKIDQNGELEFWYENKKITYDNMFNMFTDKYIKAQNEIRDLSVQKTKLEEDVEILNKTLSKKEAEYLQKEKQIATFLECKKTFFGKIKYFFKAKKKNIEAKTEEETIENKANGENKETEEKIETQTNHNEFYTVEDIIKIYKELDVIIEQTKNEKMDQEALTNKINNIDLKIKNANLYIEEIDKHGKSIFEFWKFANKDENLMLNQGAIVEEKAKRKIEKVYNYEEDKEEIGNIVDKVQREALTKEEQDMIYICSTDILRAINNIDNEEILQETLLKLKEEAKNKRELFDADKIDIFGGNLDSNINVNMLGNKKHRETKKDKLKIIDITQDTTKEEYKNRINEISKTIKNSFNKVKNGVGIPVYMVNNEHEFKGIQKCSLTPEDVIELDGENNKINLCRINLKESSKVIYFSNIIYYDNYNKTLPVGMDKNVGCILDFDKYELKQVKIDNFRISNLKNEFEIDVKEVVLQEYDIIEKTNDK